MPDYFSVVGYGSSGKTTLIRRLVEELEARGYKIAVIKHDPQGHGVVDKEGSDTHLFWEAGSKTVILSSPSRLAMFRRTEGELSLAELLSLCGDVDCVILEGYKSMPYPRVVVWDPERQPPHLPKAEVLALVHKQEDSETVKQHHYGKDIPLILRDDISALANLLEGYLQRER